MEALLSTTTPLPLSGVGRNSSLSSLHSFSKSNGVVGAINRRARSIRPSSLSSVGKPPMSIVASSVPKRGSSSANVVADGSAAVAPVSDDEVPKVSWKDVQWDSGSIGHRQPKPTLTDADKLKQMEYLTNILGSKVYDVAIESPLQLAPLLSKELGINLWLKREDTQQVFSFKIRGAYNKIAQLTPEERKNGVICASAGNHAQGVALSGQRLKCRTDIVMPKSAPPIKIEAVKRLGGIVELWGDSFDEAKERALQRSKDENKPFIAPYDDELVIAGQGTIGMEIASQRREDIHAIMVPVGGGGIVAGIVSYYKLVHPEVKIFGVEPNDQNSMAQALYRDKIVNVTDISHFADGVAVQQAGDENFRICRELLDDVVTVTADEIASAMKDMFNDERSILEPSGAISIAAAKAYCKYNNITGVNIVAVTSGANMNWDQIPEIVDRSNLESGAESLLVTKLPEKPGCLKALCELLDENINSISYRYNSDKEAILLYTLRASGSKLDNVLKRLKSSQFQTHDFSDNPVVKDHFRYLIGGRADVKDEVLCRFVFPELPGALKKFLNHFSPRWNISLLRHQQKGLVYSDVLVGLQVKKSEMDEFHNYAKKVGYRYEVVSGDDASHFLLKH